MLVLNGIFAFTGIMFLFFGYLIWRYKILGLLSGYNPKRVADKDSLAKYAGVHLTLMGILILLISIIGIFFDVNTGIPYLLIVIILSFKMAIGSRKFEKRNRE